MAFVCVGKLANLCRGDMQSVSAAGHRVLLVRHDDQVRAFEDRCAHLGQPLGEGQLRDGVIICRAHGWCYDASSGSGINPRRTQLAGFVVEVRDGEVWIDLERRSGQS